MSTESRSEQAFDQTFHSNQLVWTRIPDHLQLPSCGLDGYKEVWSNSKSQLLLFTTFSAKVKVANVTNREQRINCHLMENISLLLCSTCRVKQDLYPSGSRHHLSSTTNKKQLLITSQAGGSSGLELKLTDWNAKGPVFCKISSQSSLNVRSAPDLKSEVIYTIVCLW